MFIHCQATCSKLWEIMKILILGLLSIAFTAQAETFKTTKIVEFKSHAAPYYTEGNVWSDVTWITVEGVTSVGNTCKPTAWSNGLAPFYIRNSNAGLLSLALAAKMADKTVMVNVNPSAPIIGGACKLEYIGI